MANKEMNKKGLTKAIAEAAGMSIKESEKAVDAFITVVKREIFQANKINIAGFGTFEVTVRSAREGINPATKERIMIDETRNVKFKAGKALKDAAKGR